MKTLNCTLNSQKSLPLLSKKILKLLQKRQRY